MSIPIPILHDGCADLSNFEEEKTKILAETRDGAVVEIIVTMAILLVCLFYSVLKDQLDGDPYRRGDRGKKEFSFPTLNP